MELTIRSHIFEMCLRTSKTYSVLHERFLPPALNIRLGKWYTWSTGRGLALAGMIGVVTADK